MIQSSLFVRSRRYVRLAPTALYLSALVATIVFALTHAVPAWQAAIDAGLAALLVGIPASLLDARALTATAEWDPDRGAASSCVVFGLGALTLAAMNVVMQRNAYGIELPWTSMIGGKPDVLIAAMLLVGCVGFSITANVVGRGLARDRAIRLCAIDPRMIGPLALAPALGSRLAERES